MSHGRMLPCLSHGTKDLTSLIFKSSLIIKEICTRMKNVILQGVPGIGKTTLVKKIIDKLHGLHIETCGFYTQELRDEKNNRIGFDVISLDNHKAPLARKSSQSCKYKVGCYNVHLDEFEAVVLPIFQNLKSVVIVDEIGKMELFSEKFQSSVARILEEENTKVIATVPLKGGSAFISGIKNNPRNEIITVNKLNRDHLSQEIVSFIA